MIIMNFMNFLKVTFLYVKCEYEYDLWEQIRWDRIMLQKASPTKSQSAKQIPAKRRFFAADFPTK